MSRAKTKEIVQKLRSAGKPNTVEIYRRHGVTGDCCGVSYADLDRMKKQLGPNHDLALSLWGSELHDARVLASKIAEPQQMSARELNCWLRDVDNHVLSGAVAGVAAHSKNAVSTACRWTQRKAEWASSTGWAAVAELCMASALPQDAAPELLKRIARELPTAPNRTRHTMNGALIAIGGTMVPLRERALEIARDLGPVVVDHGRTGCKTPEAATYIENMARRQRSKGKRPSATPKSRA